MSKFISSHLDDNAHKALIIIVSFAEKTGSRSDLSHREDAISSISKKRMAKYGFPPASYHGATCLIVSTQPDSMLGLES